MSWMFRRTDAPQVFFKVDPLWKYLQSFQYGVHASFSHCTYPNLFSPFDPEDIIPPDDFVAGDEDLDSVLFGTLRGHVVGLRYYTGVVNNNEMVALQREPNNPYDKNAVKVNNVNGSQVGHIKKELAAPLAYIMDNKLAQVEGVVHYGASNAFTMPVQMSFWGKEENRKAVLDQLKKHGFKLGPPPKSSGFNFGSAWNSERAGPSYSVPIHAAVQMTTEQLKTEFDKLFEDLKEDDKTREMEPAEAIETPLLPHQKQALAWMVSRENSKELPPFWEQRNNAYYNTITNFSEKEPPENVLGGILADDMGLVPLKVERMCKTFERKVIFNLQTVPCAYPTSSIVGKTLAAIAVILTNFHDGKPLPVEKTNQLKEEHIIDKSAKQGENDDNEQVKELCKEEFTTGEEPSVSDVKEESKSFKSEFASTRPKRRKATVKYTESSDSEEVELNELPHKIKARPRQEQPVTKGRIKRFSKAKEDADFACALESSAPLVKKKAMKKGATIVQCSKKIDTEEKPRATLIICPLSVLSNWIDQFGQHIKSDVHLNLYVYYGPDRSKDPALLSKQDIVLTTYNILTYDYGSRGDSPLHKIRWLRVILDEGHTIRNPNAQQTKAALDLEAERRWVLTGTPIQNSLKDLWSLLSFLKLKPFTDREWWHRTIQRPVTMGDEGGLRRLQSLIKNITLRRTKTSKIKGKPVLELPERKVFIQHITLTDEERQIYQSVKNEGRAAIGRYFNEGTVLAHYADVLGLLLRLRQLCCHPHLFTNTASSSSPSGDDTPEELRKKLISKMKLILSSGSDEECAICLDSLNIPVITHCAHVFCKPCICQVIQNEQPNAKCPLCRNDLRAENLVECPPEELNCSAEKKTDLEWMSSSKINALMHALIDLRKKNPQIKSLVVSQFTTFLSLLETPLKASGFVFTRLDGSMAQKKRVESIQCFQNTEAGSPTIMLLSLKAGGVGLNLCAASRVFLMDPAWNPAAEDQCFDRCHRLGQKQEVVITKFIVKDSVEENMLKIQNKKRELAAGAFGTKKPNASEMKQAKINEIKTLIDL